MRKNIKTAWHVQLRRNEKATKHRLRDKGNIHCLPQKMMNSSHHEINAHVNTRNLDLWLFIKHGKYRAHFVWTLTHDTVRIVFVSRRKIHFSLPQGRTKPAHLHLLLMIKKYIVSSELPPYASVTQSFGTRSDWRFYSRVWTCLYQTWCHVACNRTI